VDKLSVGNAQSWYKVRTYDLVNPNFKISLFLQIGSVFLTFQTFVPPPNPKHKFRCTPSSSFDLWAVGKKTHPSNIRSHVAPWRNHWACLTAVECPGFGLHPCEMPEFLSPLLFLFLGFHVIVGGAEALQKRLNGMYCSTGKRAVGRAVRPISLAFVYARIYDEVPRLLQMLCPDSIISPSADH